MVRSERIGAALASINSRRTASALRNLSSTVCNTHQRIAWLHQCTRHETELFLVAQPQHGVDARNKLPDVLFVRYFDDVRLQRTRPNNDHGIRCM